MPAPGGIHGIHGTGIHGIHGAGVSGMGGTGIHGVGGTPAPGFGPPRSEVVWRCSKCNFELGRGPVDPGQPSCPSCGARFDGGTIGPGRFGAAPPPTTPSDSRTGGAPINPFAGGTTTPEVSAAPSDGGDSSSGESSPNSSGRARTIKLIGIVCGSILLLGALAALGVVVANASAAKPFRHQPTRRRIYDDE
jgi:hypothetical protein